MFPDPCDTQSLNPLTSVASSVTVRFATRKILEILNHLAFEGYVFDLVQARVFPFVLWEVLFWRLSCA